MNLVSEMQLCVIDEKQKEEQIAIGLLSNPKLMKSDGQMVSKLVVSNYSRDPAIMQMGEEKSSDGGSMNAEGASVQHRMIMLFCEEAANKKALLRFGGYLRERKKAGVCKVDGKRIFLLPPASSASELIKGVIMTEEAVASMQQRSVQQAPQKVAPAPAKPAAKRGGLLAALASKVSSTSTARGVIHKQEVKAAQDFVTATENTTQIRLKVSVKLLLKSRKRRSGTESDCSAEECLHTIAPTRFDQSLTHNLSINPTYYSLNSPLFYFLYFLACLAGF